MNPLQQEINEWQRATFPAATFASTYAHLEDEMIEIIDADTDADERMEIADACILLFGLAGLSGFDLLKAVREKLEINKTRQWGEADERGVVRHVETYTHGGGK